ncbi:hypothetical protein JWR97_02020 [Pseudomonas cedrina subsp. fulgida]|nr:hypothetical protein [Pseudomonas cedrina subsp. fulgida]
MTIGKAASGDNNDITSLRALNADGFDRIRQGLAPLVGASASVAGTKGLVPAPSISDRLKVLSGAGTWVTLPTGATWGTITGTLSAQADLQAVLSTLSGQEYKTDIETLWTGTGAPTSVTLGRNLVVGDILFLTHNDTYNLSTAMIPVRVTTSGARLIFNVGTNLTVVAFGASANLLSFIQYTAGYGIISINALKVSKK